MNDLTVLHFSDLHIDGNGKKYSELLKALLLDIKKQVDALPNARFVTLINAINREKAVHAITGRIKKEPVHVPMTVKDVKACFGRDIRRMPKASFVEIESE